VDVHGDGKGDVRRLEVGQVEADHHRELADVPLGLLVDEAEAFLGLRLVGACLTFLATRFV
jgi:hypothetical protein